MLICLLSCWEFFSAPALLGQTDIEETVSPNPRLMNAELLQRGKALYTDHCYGCHGLDGDGKGPGAYGLIPKPRDFASATFKFRSTPQGALPTDEDLVRSIRQGILGTSMPGFELMPERDVLALAQHIKTFSEAWQDPNRYAPPLPSPHPPAWLVHPYDHEKEWQIHAGAGKQLFTSFCAPCHGEGGKGNGPAAAALTDSWGYPIKPTDLTKPYIHSGRTLSDVYKAISTGLNGSPMPGFYESTTEEQRWELTAYIQSLRSETPVIPEADQETASVTGEPNSTSISTDHRSYE